MKRNKATVINGHDHNKLDEEEKTLYFSLVASETLAAAEAEFATKGRR